MVKKSSLLLSILMVVILCSCADKNKSSTNDDPFEGWDWITEVIYDAPEHSDPDLTIYKDCEGIANQAASIMLCELKSIEKKQHLPGFESSREYFVLKLLPVKQFKGEFPEEVLTIYHDRYVGNGKRLLSSVYDANKSQLKNTLCIVALREVCSPYYNGNYDIIAFMPFINGTINKDEVTENSTPEGFPKYYIFDTYSQIFQNINNAVIDSPENGDPYLYNCWETTNLEKIVKISSDIIKIRVTNEHRQEYYGNTIIACEVLKSLKGGPHGYKNKWVYIRFKEGDVVPDNEYIVCLENDKYVNLTNKKSLKKHLPEQYHHIYEYSATKSVFDVSQEKEIKKLIKKSTN